MRITDGAGNAATIGLTHQEHWIGPATRRPINIRIQANTVAGAHRRDLDGQNRQKIRRGFRQGGSLVQLRNSDLLATDVPSQTGRTVNICN
jgi:hypothetical protein